MKNLLRGMLILLASVCSSNALAIGSHQWAIIGLGTKSCGSYIVAMSAAHNDPSLGVAWNGQTFDTTAMADTEWVDGYISAVNLLGKPGAGQITTDYDGIAMWIERYCKDHPDEKLVWAAAAFVRSQHKPQ